MKLFISHGQISVFDPSLENPFNDWLEGHVRQGFSWRPGSVSFSTLEEAGEVDIRVTVQEGDYFSSDDAIRIIEVPFEIADERGVEIASIVNSEIVDIKKGRYRLIFETGFVGDSVFCRFVFIPVSKLLKPIIHLADDSLQPSSDFLMDASPAI